MFQRVLTEIARALGTAQIPYMVIGGQAVLLYGEPRITIDIDITLGVDVDKLEHVLAAVRPAHFEILPANVQEFTGKTRVLPLRDSDSGIRVDLIFSFSSYEQEAIRRAKSVQIRETEVRYASLEDVLVHKMVAGRARDVEDVRGILARNPTFDRTYVLKWLRAFDAVIGRNISAEFNTLINS